MNKSLKIGFVVAALALGGCVTRPVEVDHFIGIRLAPNFQTVATCQPVGIIPSRFGGTLTPSESAIAVPVMKKGVTHVVLLSGTTANGMVAAFNCNRVVSNAQAVAIHGAQ